MFAASIQGGGVLAKANLKVAQVQCRPDSPLENLSVGMGPVCWTLLPTGLSEWELGPRHAEGSPIKRYHQSRRAVPIWMAGTTRRTNGGFNKIPKKGVGKHSKS